MLYVAGKDIRFTVYPVAVGERDYEFTSIILVSWLEAETILTLALFEAYHVAVCELFYDCIILVEHNYAFRCSNDNLASVNVEYADDLIVRLVFGFDHYDRLTLCFKLLVFFVKY